VSIDLGMETWDFSMMEEELGAEWGRLLTVKPGVLKRPENCL